MREAEHPIQGHCGNRWGRMGPWAVLLQNPCGHHCTAPRPWESTHHILQRALRDQYSQCAHSTDRKVKAWGTARVCTGLSKPALLCLAPYFPTWPTVLEIHVNPIPREITRIIFFFYCFPFQRSTKLISSFSSSWVSWIQTPISVRSFSW